VGINQTHIRSWKELSSPIREGESVKDRVKGSNLATIYEIVRDAGTQNVPKKKLKKKELWGKEKERAGAGFLQGQELEGTGNMRKGVILSLPTSSHQAAATEKYAWRGVSASKWGCLLKRPPPKQE